MKRSLGFLALLIGIIAAVGMTLRPSNQRDWSPDQLVLPEATVDLPFVTVRNIRNFRYRGESAFTPGYYDRRFDLRKLDSMWFVVEPFGRAGAAHTFVSYGFGDEFVGISIEIRKEKGESFSPLKGLLRQYELMYVIGDERDLIGLRANHRHDDVYLYRVRATPEAMRQMFVEMVSRAERLRKEPEFYNTLTNTCTTNLVRHVNTIAPKRVPLRASVFLPANSDRLAYEIGLIDTTRPFDQVRQRSKINALAAKYADAEDFSLKIRAGIRIEN
jgi:hypothetical protein